VPSNATPEGEMHKSKRIALMSGAACAAMLAGVATAEEFNIPGGDMKSALDAYAKQARIQLIYSDDVVKDARTKGMKGDISPDAALTRLLSGSGLTVYRRSQGVIAIVRDSSASIEPATIMPMQLAQAAPTRAAVETVTVTSSKLGGADVQSIPIAITALSQEQLTATQTAGGPGLVKQGPNLTFTPTNFSGYSIQIRGIGTQAISVTTDPAVAVAFNDIPFIRNHFFEQEFYDVSQVEILRGPQGTLYGRNATAGVVNLISARPTDQFEAMISAELGNYHQRRVEAMVNLPIVDDRLDIRVAGEWTKRQGYSFNELTNDRIDGRDLWSGRVTIGLKPVENLQLYLVWEHFSEDDDRIRSAKQLCKRDPGVGEIDGVPKLLGPNVTGDFSTAGNFFDQGCLPTSLYSPEAFGAPIGYTLPYVTGGQLLGRLQNIDPYATTMQTPNLRVIESSIDPIYKAKNDVAEFNAAYSLSPALAFTSQTGFSHDFLYSAEDFNRFGATPGLFNQNLNTPFPGIVSPEGVFCDPQLGCSDRLILEDLSQEHAWQLSQEFRLESHFSGPLNFSVGGNYLHYETQENYYVFSNIFTMITVGCASGRPCNLRGANPYVPNVYDNSAAFQGFEFNDPSQPAQISGGYIDPNPLSEINDNGHNYFLSQNPYVLNYYAAFGEANYNIVSDLKLVVGLRWTEDQKHFVEIPSWLVSSGWGYPVAGVIDQQWDQFTGRAVVNWTPKLNFTDQTLVYGSYAHGYKAGGANPPGAIFSTTAFQNGEFVSLQPTHPLTFKPEFVDAFELGTKNTLLDGALTLNGNVFYYNYQAYQVSQIVDRTAVNLNFNAHAKGAELEATWEPLPGLRFNFSGGWEDTAIAKGQSAVDLMDRTAGQPGWYVLRPFVNEASNCIFPDYVAKHIDMGSPTLSATAESYCAYAYLEHLDPITRLGYKADPTVAYPGLTIPAGYPGFDPLSAPNNGAGFSKDLGGNSLPNAPPYTVSVGAQYTIPLSSDWAGTLRSDFYWQDASWWRVFNDLSYDRLHGYTNLNLTLILTSQNGWQVMLYDKNVFNTTAITGAFLNSDDTDLTTNVFLTDPKLIGIRVTKNW
jgi:outer membrane receptor protein involved in Fe transport